MTGEERHTAENDVPRRIAGHALTMEWSGEYGTESSSTGTCKCGQWEESASSQNEVRFEYRMHLRRVWKTRVIPPGKTHEGEGG